MDQRDEVVTFVMQGRDDVGTDGTGNDRKAMAPVLEGVILRCQHFDVPLVSA
jgi:hypothetical protein